MGRPEDANQKALDQFRKCMRQALARQESLPRALCEDNFNKLLDSALHIEHNVVVEKRNINNNDGLPMEIQLQKLVVFFDLKINNAHSNHEWW